MEVILLQDVEKVGLRGDVVDVARGYARNFLLPRRLAELATPARVAELQKRDSLRSRQEAKSFEGAQEIAELLGKTILRFEVKAGPTGALFGSVTPTDVVDELWRTSKVRVDRRKIQLAEPIKRIGRYELPIDLFQDVTVQLQTHVVPEGGELPPEEELPPAPAEDGAEAPPSDVVDTTEASVAEVEAPAEAEAEAEADEPEPEPEAEAAEPSTDEPEPES